MEQNTLPTSFVDRVLYQRMVKQMFFFEIDKVVTWHPIRNIVETAYTKGIKSTVRRNCNRLVLFNYTVKQNQQQTTQGINTIKATSSFSFVIPFNFTEEVKAGSIYKLMEMISISAGVIMTSIEAPPKMCTSIG